ncbi:MAG: Fe-S cluster assembly protein SufB [bacterium]
MIKDNKNYAFKSELGLNEKIVREISVQKQEPEWMLEIRLKALKHFVDSEMPKWGPDLSVLDPQNIFYYVKQTEKVERSWSDVPEDVKQTFEHLGLPQAEKQYLAGLGAQYESETVYHNLKKEWAEKGVIFLDTDSALKEFPEIFKEYFGTVVPYNDNKFAALNTAVWSGGSFIYVPPKVHVTVPLQAYFRINAERVGQFERTLIIADQDSIVTYVEGCTAPAYSTSALHSAVVEIIAKPSSRVRYYTIQNWSKNVFNLVTKRAVAYKNSVIEWIDGNLGSNVTMKYPAVVLKEEGAKAEVLSIAIASSHEQVQDTGAKMIHLASNTSSRVISKSISRNGGRSSYRGLIKVIKGAKHCKSFVQCDALIFDKKSRSDAYPTMNLADNTVNCAHEASVSKIDDDQLFYLISRGIDANSARTMIVNGFVEPFVKELPMEFAVEINRLIELEMEGSVG